MTNTLKMNKLKMISVNVDSIITNQRRNSLLNFLKIHNPDIVAISETKLNSKHKIDFKDYNIIRRDRPNATQGGGVAILIRKNLKFRRLMLSEVEQFKNLEIVTISLNLPDNQKLYIIAAYAAYGERLSFNKEIETLFQVLQLDDPDNYFVMAGDLNARHTSWLNQSFNTRGTFLKKWLDDNEIKYKLKLYTSSLPSYPRGNSYLDLCIADTRLEVSKFNKTGKVETLEYDSDHNAIQMQISYKNDNYFILEKRENNHKFNFRNSNWEKFSDYLAQTYNLKIPNNRNLSNEEIDSYLKDINEAIKITMNNTIPKIKSKNSMECYQTPLIKKIHKQKSKLITKINKFYKNFQTHNNRELSLLQNKLITLKALLKQEYINSINKHWAEKVSKIPVNDSKNMFPQVNQIFRAKGKVLIPQLKIQTQDRPFLQDANVNINSLLKDEADKFIISNEEDKLKIIGTHFQNTHTKFLHLGREGLNRIIQRKISNFEQEIINDNDNNKATLIFSNDLNSDNINALEEKIPNLFTSKTRLKNIFKNLNNKKSSGIDGIPNIVLKHITPRIINDYCILFNNMLNNSFFPTNWKKSKITPIPKKGKDSVSPGDFRPISLLPNISKVFEVIVKDSLLQLCAEKDIINESQFGFRHKHSTIHAINKLTSDVCWAINNKHYVGACLIDLEKAFDTVWIDGLIFKLLKNTFPTYLIKIIREMITGKSFIITDGNITLDKDFLVLNGLHQGAVLSPILFNIYTHEILKMYGINSDVNKRAIAFADDIVIYTIGKKIPEIQESLQDLFEKVQYYMHTWKLKINVLKCETILFRPPLNQSSRSARRNWRTFQIKEQKEGGEPVPHKTLVKYLGFNLDQTLYFNKHIDIQLRKATNAFSMLKRLVYNKHLNYKIKIKCYLLIIRPLLTYACPIWYNISPSIMERIRIFERKCLRACLGKYRTAESDYQKYISNEEIYNLANVNKIDTQILKITRNHFANTRTVKDNSLIFGIYYPNDQYYANVVKTNFIPPEAFMYLDKNGYIQDIHGAPIIYHYNRHATNKNISYDKNLDTKIPNEAWRFTTCITNKEHKDKHRSNIKKYFWLAE